MRRAGASAPRPTLSLQSVIYAYDGWTGVIYFSEELHEPARRHPALDAGRRRVGRPHLLLVNLALLYVLPSRRVAGETFGGRQGRGRDLRRARRHRHPRGGGRRASSSVNALLLITTAVPSRCRATGCSRRASRRQRGRHAHRRLATSAAVALIFLVGESFNQIIAVATFFFVANYAVSFTAVFVLRRREPRAARPWRARGPPLDDGARAPRLARLPRRAVAADTRNSSTPSRCWRSVTRPTFSQEMSKDVQVNVTSDKKKL